MDKKVILFDIDRTIFDTGKMLQAIDRKILKLLGKAQLKDFEGVKEEYLASLKYDREFEPRMYTKILCDEFGFPEQNALLDVFYGSENIYMNCLYPDTITVFEKLKNHFRLGIFSKGTREFQNHKFKSLNLDSFIKSDLVFIFDQKTTKAAIRKIPKEAIVVDDKESVAEYLFGNSIRVIWLNKIDKIVGTGFETIFSLSELPSKLNGSLQIDR